VITAQTQTPQAAHVNATVSPARATELSLTAVDLAVDTVTIPPAAHPARKRKSTSAPALAATASLSADESIFEERGRREEAHKPVIHYGTCNVSLIQRTLGWSFRSHMSRIRGPVDDHGKFLPLVCLRILFNSMHVSVF